jgi:phospholipid N-methyltransferase
MKSLITVLIDAKDDLIGIIKDLPKCYKTLKLIEHIYSLEKDGKSDATIIELRDFLEDCYKEHNYDKVDYFLYSINIDKLSLKFVLTLYHSIIRHKDKLFQFPYTKTDITHYMDKHYPGKDINHYFRNFNVEQVI